MKYVIQGRRIEFDHIDFSKIDDIYDNIHFTDYLSPIFREALNRNFKLKNAKNLFMKFNEMDLDIKLYKDKNHKFWLVNTFNYIYEGKMSREFHRWYGSVQVIPFLNYFNCEMTLFVHSEWEDNYFSDATGYFLYPIDDRLLYGKSRQQYVSSLRDVLRLNILSPIHTIKRSGNNEENWRY